MFRQRPVTTAILAACVGTITACTLLSSLDGLAGGMSSSGGVIVEGGGGDGPVIVLDSGGDDARSDASAESRYAAAVRADAPILYYRFGEPEGAPARDEITGNTTPYSVQGVTLGAAGALAGDPNTAIALDGSGKLQLTQDASFVGMKPHSVEAWVRRAPSSNNLGFLVDHEAWSGGRRGWALRANATAFVFERSITVDGGLRFDSVGTDEPIVASEWKHVVGTFDGKDLRLYVDTTRRDMRGAGIALTDLGGPFTVGKQNCSPCTSTGFIGNLDELAIYDKALSETRILAHFNAGKGL